MDATRKLPRLKTVEPLPGRSLRLTWKDGSKQAVDLTGLIARSRHFAALEDETLWNSAAVIEWGDGVEWENGLDISAERLARMAEAQLEMARKTQES